MKKPPAMQRPRPPQPCALRLKRQTQASSAQGHRQVRGQTRVLCAPRTQRLEEGETNHCVVMGSAVDGSRSMTLHGEDGDGDWAEGGVNGDAGAQGRSSVLRRLSPRGMPACSFRPCGPWKGVPCVTRPPHGRLSLWI